MFAQAPVPPPAPAPKAIFKNAELYLAFGALAGIMLLAALIFHFMGRWRKREDTEATGGLRTTLDLTDFREMYENGEITQKEYERIRDKLAAKMKQEVGLEVPAAPPAAPVAPPQPPPPDGSAPPPAAT